MQPMTDNSADEWITIEEAAQLADVVDKTIRRWADAGNIDSQMVRRKVPVRPQTKAVRLVRRADVLRQINSADDARTTPIVTQPAQPITTGVQAEAHT